MTQEKRKEPETAILIVDDEEVIRDMVARVLKYMKIPSATAEDGLAALEMLKEKEFGVILADIRMPNLDGMQLLAEVRKAYPQTDVLIMTAHTSKYSYVDVVEGGAVDYIMKPFSVEELKAKIERVLRERRIIRELHEKSRKLEEAYAEILMLKDEEEKICRDINYEKEFLGAEIERVKKENSILEERLKQLDNR